MTVQRQVVSRRLTLLPIFEMANKLLRKKLLYFKKSDYPLVFTKHSYEMEEEREFKESGLRNERERFFKNLSCLLLIPIVKKYYLKVREGK